MQNGKEITFDEVLLPGAGSLLPFLDRRMFVWLRDGRTFVGWLRSIDQFANLVLWPAAERLYAGEGRFADLAQGIVVVRGENVALFGEQGAEGEGERAPVAQALQAADRLRNHRRREEAYRKRGLVFSAEDYF